MRKTGDATRNNRLIRKKGVEIPKGVNNYGMKLKRYTKEKKEHESA